MVAAIVREATPARNSALFFTDINQDSDLKALLQ
jgi:hypothetical protein